MIDVPIIFSTWASTDKPPVLTVKVHLTEDGEILGLDLEAIEGHEDEAAKLAFALGAKHMEVFKLCKLVREIQRRGKP